MPKRSAPPVIVYRQLTLLVTLSFALGCTIDAHPSLGRYERAELPIDKSSAGGTNAAIANPMLDASSANAAPSPAATATSRGSTSDASAAQAEAGLVRPDAAPAAVPDASDAATSAGSCKEGSYLGNFTCSADTPGSVIGSLSTVQMQAALNLRQTSPNVLALASSSLAFDANGFMFASDLAGQLDCGTGVFHADLVNGTFAATLSPIPISLSGVIDGALDRAKKSLAGSWSITAPDGTTCAGNWDAALPP